MVYAAKSAFGRIDIMVNNAGYTHRNGDMLEVDEETFDLITAVNMKAIYHAALAVVPIMERQGGGVILTTASTAGLGRGPASPGTTPRRAGRSPRPSRWRSSSRRRTSASTASARSPARPACWRNSWARTRRRSARKFRASIPLGRLSTPLDIANAALWLASDEAAFITGVALEVDGGRCI